MKVKEFTPPQAWDFLESTPAALLLDVRSTLEYEYVGHPIRAVHVPLKEAPSWQLDPRFTEHVRAMILGQKADPATIEQTPVLTICRSGMRSAVAADLLLKDGFTEVYNVIEGFEGDRDEKNHRNTINGWRFYNLPWEQS